MVRAEQPIPDDQDACVVPVAGGAVVHPVRHRGVQDVLQSEWHAVNQVGVHLFSAQIIMGVNERMPDSRTTHCQCRHKMAGCFCCIPRAIDAALRLLARARAGGEPGTMREKEGTAGVVPHTPLRTQNWYNMLSCVCPEKSWGENPSSAIGTYGNHPKNGWSRPCRNPVLPCRDTNGVCGEGWWWWWWWWGVTS